MEPVLMMTSPSWRCGQAASTAFKHTKAARKENLPREADCQVGALTKEGSGLNLALGLNYGAQD
jgi:hypothetical protein